MRATARLDPDIVVLCVNAPNDLSPWDRQLEWRERRRPGAFSAAHFFFGQAACQWPV